MTRIIYYINIILLFAVVTLVSEQNATISFPEYESLKKDSNTVNLLVKEGKKNRSFDTNIAISNLALNIAEGIGYNYGVAQALDNLAFSNYLSADYEKALFFYNKKLSICKKYNSFGDKSIIAETFRVLGEVGRANKDYIQALVDLDSAEKLFKSCNDLYGLSKTYNRKASVIFELSGFGNDKRIIDYLDKSNKIAKENGYNEVIANNLNLYASYYTNHGSVNEAIDTYKSTLLYFSDDDEFSEKSTVYRNLSTTYAKINKIDSSLHYGRLAFEEANKNNVNVHMFNSAWALYKLFLDNVKNSDSALYYLNKTLHYQNLIFDTEKIMAKIQVQYKYDSEIRNKEIENQRDINFYQKIVFTFVILFLIIITFIIYLKYNSDKKANTLIKNQKDELTILNADKDKLFSIIAHDLRNPLGAFKSIVDLMYADYEGFSDKERVELIKIMKESSDSLLTLLENLLTWSKNQRGAILYNPEKIGLKMVVDNLLNILKSSATNKSIKLVNNIDKSIYLFADLQILNTILRNVVSNSIKFSHNGTNITLSSNFETIDKEEFVKITIIDNGVGMSSEKLSSLFSVALNKSVAGTNGEKGTGLGMILVNDFLKINKGKINIESEVGKGTTVNLFFPRYEVN